MNIIKKILIISSVLVLTACTQQNTNKQQAVTTTSADSNLVPVSNINRLQSASDIYQTGDYYFNLNTEASDDTQTYKLSEQMKITSNDQQEYKLYQSTKPISDLTNLEYKKFTGDIKLKTDQAMYYVLVGENGEVDVTISTM